MRLQQHRLKSPALFCYTACILASASNALAATPIAVADSMTVNQGDFTTTLVGGASSVLDNDSGATSASIVTSPTRGSVNLHANGSFKYTQNGSSKTSDSFTYKACDSSAPPLCSNAVTVSITINLKPVARCSPPTQVLVEDDNVLLFGSQLFSDPEMQALTYLGSSLPPGLSIDNSTGILTGTPTEGDAAASPYMSAFRVRDPQLAQATADVQFVVLTAADYLFRNSFDSGQTFCP